MSSPILVTSYRDPDLDGTAGAFAYAELLNAQGQPATAAVLGTPHLEARHVSERFHISLPSDTDPHDYEQIILIDTSNLNDQDPRLPIERVIKIIDHRKIHEGEKFPNAHLQIELVGSAATLVTEHLNKANTIPSRKATLLLFGAIASNTVNFKANVTTERDRRMATWLQSLHEIPGDFIPVMFAAKSNLEGDKLRETLLGDYSSRKCGDLEIGISQLEIVNAKYLVETRKDELLTIVEELRKAHPDSDRIFISAIDILEGYNIFLVPEADMREMLSKILGITFDEHHIAYRSGILMRKEIGPMIKDYIEKGMKK